MSDFFIFLPSNSNLDIYPENVCGDFRVNLAEEVNLSGQWVCGLVEFHFPKTFRNIEDGRYELKLFGDKEKIFNFPGGYYSDIKDIVGEINSKIKILGKNHVEVHGKQGIELSYNENTRKVSITITGDSHICLGTHLRKILGFVCEFDNSVQTTPYEVPITSSVEADYTYDIPQSPLYIYSNLIENIRIGDSQGPILRIVDSKGKLGDRICRVFERPYYFPVRQNHFRQIHVQIRFNNGQIPIFYKGHSALVLHFKKKLNLLRN